MLRLLMHITRHDSTSTTRGRGLASPHVQAFKRCPRHLALVCWMFTEAPELRFRQLTDGNASWAHVCVCGCSLCCGASPDGPASLVA